MIRMVLTMRARAHAVRKPTRPAGRRPAAYPRHRPPA